MGLILRQAIVLSAIGAVVGMAVVAAVQGAFSTPRAPIAIPWYMAAGSIALVTMICLTSSLLAVSAGAAHRSGVGLPGLTVLEDTESSM